MKRMPMTRILTILLVLALFAALPIAGGCDKDEETPDVPVAEEADSGSESADGEAVTDADDAVETPAEDGSGAGEATNAPATITVRLYWVEAGENAIGIERTLPYTQAVATAAMNALLAGPTAQEQATWPAISSAIPAGTTLNGVTVAGGVAKVDLSSEFESGGGTFSVTARLAQVVYTLEQFPTVDAVEFYLDGVKVEMFSGEGLILDGPQTLDDYDGYLPIDA
ncbi:MAG: GerMN domain-containing protein [Coriobacteriia bacterium]|nr:GerMN domain-containing protein [Coriobacteriia bacterium]